MSKQLKPDVVVHYETYRIPEDEIKKLLQEHYNLGPKLDIYWPSGFGHTTDVVIKVYK